MNHYLIIGLGKIGLPVANGLAEQGHQVIGVNRSYRSQLHNAITLVETDARFLDHTALGSDGEQITHACIIVSPSQMGEQGYRDSYFAICENFIKVANQLPKLKRVVFISSTGVYGQNSGEVIDINTPISPPLAKTSQVLLATEQLLQQAFQEKCTIIRPSGIYGDDRLRLLTMAKNIAHGKPAPDNTWTNRIFDTDLIAIILHVLQTAAPLPVYLATDNAPVPLYTVLQYLLDQSGYANSFLPNETPTTGKRIDNNLPSDWLTVPNYQAGYQRILAQQLSSQPL